MKRSEYKRAVTVGIFIVLAIAIFIIGVLTLGGQKNTFEKKITVKAVFADVGGLQTGNNVWYLGVKVGTIRAIKFVKNSQVEVDMDIQSDAQKYIKKDAKVKVSSESFIGNKIILISGGSDAAPSIAENDYLQVESGLNTEEILASFQKNNKNLLDITNNIKLVSERLAAGKGTIGKLLSDETLLNNINLAVLKLNQASSNAQRLTADIAAYSARINDPGSFTNDLVTDTVIFRKLRATARELQDASITIHEASDNIKLASSNVKEVSNKVNSDNSTVGVLLNDTQAAANLKATLSNIEAGTKKFDETMEALQHNFLLRGFFKKKEKQKAEEQKLKVDIEQ